MTVPPPSQPPPEDPHEGSEDDPRRELDERDEQAVLPPRRYEPDEPAPGTDVVVGSRREPTLLDRLESASGPLALVTFFLIGFGTGRWYIAWIVFFIPAILRAWNRPSKK